MEDTRSTENHKFTGVSERELTEIVDSLRDTEVENIEVVAAYCCDLIQRMKIELDMYCPDRQHLYFVSL